MLEIYVVSAGTSELFVFICHNKSMYFNLIFSYVVFNTLMHLPVNFQNFLERFAILKKLDIYAELMKKKNMILLNTWACL